MYLCECNKTKTFLSMTPVIVLGGQETKYKPNIYNCIYIYTTSPAISFHIGLLIFSLINAIDKKYIIQINNYRIYI